MRFIAAALVVVGLSASQIIVRVLVPQLASISPSSGAVGASVTLTGVNFGVRQENSVLVFNGTAASPSAWSDASITTLVPVGATTGSVTLTRGGRTSNGLAFTVSSGSCSPSPCISGVTGTASNGSPLTVSGAGFGATGPTVGVFDDFEAGTNGSQIPLNNAEVGAWSGRGTGYVPTYDNSQHASGSLSMMADMTADQMSVGSAMVYDFISHDVFFSFQVMVPLTSSFPGVNNVNGDATNWKITWIYRADTTDFDRVIPGMAGGPATAPWDNWQSFCNNCPGTGYFWGGSSGAVSTIWTMTRGRWYRFMVYLHATSSLATSVEHVWISSLDEGKAVTQHVTTPADPLMASDSDWREWLLNGYGRSCGVGTVCRPHFDDAYFATGTNGTAQARVEIVNNSVYNSATALALCTTTSWTATSIVCNLRKGQLSNGTNYAFVTLADGSHIGPQAVTVS